MRICEIVGTVTLSRSIPEFQGATLKLGVPLSLKNLLDEEPPQADSLVVWDATGSGMGCRVALI